MRLLLRLENEQKPASIFRILLNPHSLKSALAYTDMQSISSFKIHQAVEKIKNGEVIAYPTEAVFGLGCDPLNEEAVLNLLALKNRSVDKGLILIA